MLISRALGLVLGVAADAALGDPRRHHPVAWFGTWAGACERLLWADSTGRGAFFCAATVLPVTATALALEFATARRPVAHTLATATTTWVVLGARSLAAEGRTMAAFLDAGDLEAARGRLGHLCGRDPRGLAADELARATVESIAENTDDAVVASLWWGAVAGLPGLVTHRALNTLDAMVGHRDARRRHFGTASALADDAAAFVPARLTGVLACALGPLVGGSARDAWHIMCRDAHRHPSPNGGWCEAAFAGALGVELGGRNVYAGRVEHRGRLGDGPRPDAGATRRAARLSGAVTVAATVVAVGTLGLAGLADRPGRGRKGQP